MTGRADMLRARRRPRFGMLFSIVAALLVTLAVPPAWAADLDLPTNEKILEALKAKRLMRCPQAGTRPRCGGVRLQKSASENPGIVTAGRALPATFNRCDHSPESASHPALSKETFTRRILDSLSGAIRTSAAGLHVPCAPKSPLPVGSQAR